MNRLGCGSFAARLTLTLLLLLTVRLEARSSSTKTGDSLETIVSRYSDLASFLADPRALEEYETALRAYYGRALFPCENPENILQELKTLIAAEPSLAVSVWKKSTSPAIEIAWRETSESPEQVFRFVQASRPFHAVWEDLSQKSCPRSDCRQSDMSHPGRWAALLEGAQLYRVEKGDRFTGATVLVTQVSREGKPLALVSASGHALFSKRGWAASTQGKAPRVATLLEHFAEGAKLEAGVRVKGPALSAPAVSRFSDGAAMGNLIDLAFADPAAEKIDAVLPPRCASGKTGNLLSGFGGAVAKAPTDGVGTFTAAEPAAAQADKETLAQIVLNLSGKKKDAPSDPIAIEMLLGGKLKNDPNETRRAQAALGLDLLGRSFVDPGSRAKFADGRFTPAGNVSYLVPQTAVALQGAMKDPSETVRGLAAISLANTEGGTSRPGVIQNLAARIRPDTVFSQGSPARASLDATELVNKQVDPLLRNNEPLPRPLIDRMYDQLARETNPDKQRALVDRVVETYFASEKTETYEGLRANLSLHPELAAQVLQEIERRGISSCSKKTEDKVKGEKG